MSAVAVSSDLKHDLVIERSIAAPGDLLFEVWSQPKHLVNWWGPSNFSLPVCDLDFRTGGQYRFCMRSPEGVDHWVFGEYIRIDENRSIEMTWNRENPDGTIWCRTILALTFHAIGDLTLFRLHQREFDSIEHRDDHRGGWSECLDRLMDYVTVS